MAMAKTELEQTRKKWPNQRPEHTKIEQALVRLNAEHPEQANNKSLDRIEPWMAGQWWSTTLGLIN